MKLVIGSYGATLLGCSIVCKYLIFSVSYNEFLSMQITTFNISLVVHGTVAEYHNYPKVSY